MTPIDKIPSDQKPKPSGFGLKQALSKVMMVILSRWMGGK